MKNETKRVNKYQHMVEKAHPWCYLTKEKKHFIVATSEGAHDGEGTILGEGFSSLAAWRSAARSLDKI